MINSIIAQIEQEGPFTEANVGEIAHTQAFLVSSPSMKSEISSEPEAFDAKVETMEPLAAEKALAEVETIEPLAAEKALAEVETIEPLGAEEPEEALRAEEPLGGEESFILAVEEPRGAPEPLAEKSPATEPPGATELLEAKEWLDSTPAKKKPRMVILMTPDDVKVQPIFRSLFTSSVVF
jgi:hypothetical protein